MWDVWNAILAHLYSDVTLIEVFRSLKLYCPNMLYVFFYTCSSSVKPILP